MTVIGAAALLLIVFSAKGEVSKKYGSVVNLAVTKLSSRHTFLIDAQGVIRTIWNSVDVSVHSREILAALDELQKPDGASAN